jgi:hypothetical protein
VHHVGRPQDRQDPFALLALALEDRILGAVRVPESVLPADGHRVGEGVDDAFGHRVRERSAPLEGAALFGPRGLGGGERFFARRGPGLQQQRGCESQDQGGDTERG